MNSSSSNANQNNKNNNYHNLNPLQQRKSTGGRRKLPMEKIENETNRQVTFSKRKGGLLKKASELSTLTGIEIALMIFSPGGKPYSYGNPSIERVISRWMYANAYTHDEGTPDSTVQPLILSGQNEEIGKSERKVEVERNRRRDLMSMEKAAQLSGTYPPDLKTLRYDDFCALKASILGFKRSFEAKMKEAEDIATSAMLLMTPQRGQCSFSNDMGSSSSSHMQRNRVRDPNQTALEVSTNSNNQGMYTGKFFNPGGFASYNPSSSQYGGSSSFAFPSSSNACQHEGNRVGDDFMNCDF